MNIRDLDFFYFFFIIANYLNKYPSALAELGDNLRELTKRNVPFA